MAPRRPLLAPLLLAGFCLVLMRAIGPDRSLDRLPWYTAERAMALLRDLGPEGRLRYLRNECLDLVFLLAYSVLAFRATALIWGGRLSAPAVRRAQCLALVPGALDLGETSLAILALLHYPEVSSANLALLCAFTPAKWLAAALLVASALIGAVSRRFGIDGGIPAFPEK